MGLTYNNNLTTNKSQFKSRARVTFTLSGETDGGLAFGASFRADNAAATTVTTTSVCTTTGTVVAAPGPITATTTCTNTNANGGGAINGMAGSVFISGDFGKLSMGDVDSALEVTAFRTRHIGVLETHGGARTTVYAHAADPAALYEYTIDGLKVAVSAGQIGSKEFSAGVQYKFDGFGVALGYFGNSTAGAAVKSAVVASFEGSFDNVNGRVSIGQAKSAAGVKTNNYGMDVRAKFDALEVQFNAVQTKAGTHAAVRTLGAGATYSLGGGATLGGGVSKASNAKAVADFGLAFRF